MLKVPGAVQVAALVKYKCRLFAIEVRCEVLIRQGKQKQGSRVPLCYAGGIGRNEKVHNN